MKHVIVDLGLEPVCLVELRETGQTYDDLVGICKGHVQDQLSVAQSGVCAYCEQAFTSMVFIEHYIARKLDPGRELDFDNFLGICSGKHYTNRSTGVHIRHCGDSRGARPLRVNPKDKTHLDQIHFENDATIRSNNQEHDEDLTTVLNLNFTWLRERRNQEFFTSLDNFVTAAVHLNLPKQEVYARAIRLTESSTYEFAGYLMFRYRQLLENEIISTQL